MFRPETPALASAMFSENPEVFVKKSVFIVAASSVILMSVSSPATADTPAETPVCAEQELSEEQIARTLDSRCSYEGSLIHLSSDLTFLVPVEGELVSVFVNSEIPGESISADVANLGADGVVLTVTTPSADPRVSTSSKTMTYGSPETVEIFEDLQETAIANKSEETSPELSRQPGSASTAYAAAASVKCTNSTRKWIGRDWEGTSMGWYYNGAGVGYPTTLLQGIQRGGYITAEGVNNCNLSQAEINFNQRYNGATTRTANIYTDTGICDNNHDGTSTVSWGPGFETGVLALTCSWATVGTINIIEADIAFNSTRQWHSGTDACPSTSYRRMNQVAAHEFGHAFGLGDVDNSSEQLMRGNTYGCEANGTLGLGDWVAMADIY